MLRDLLAKLIRGRILLEANRGLRIGLSARRTPPIQIKTNAPRTDADRRIDQSLNRHLQILGCPERDFLACLDLDCFSGCRISAHASGSLSNLQNAKAHNADSVAFFEMLCNRDDEIAEDGFTCSFRQLMLFG